MLEEKKRAVAEADLAEMSLVLESKRAKLKRKKRELEDEKAAHLTTQRALGKSRSRKCRELKKKDIEIKALREALIAAKKQASTEVTVNQNKASQNFLAGGDI